MILGKSSKTKSFSYPTYWGHKAFKQNRSDSFSEKVKTCSKWELTLPSQFKNTSQVCVCFVQFMHPGLADLVGRILEFELQTKIRGPRFLAGLVITVWTSSWVGTHLIYKKQKPKLTDKSGIPVSLRNLSQAKYCRLEKEILNSNNVNVYFCGKDNENYMEKLQFNLFKIISS